METFYGIFPILILIWRFHLGKHKRGKGRSCDNNFQITFYCRSLLYKVISSCSKPCAEFFRDVAC